MDVLKLPREADLHFVISLENTVASRQFSISFHKAPNDVLSGLKCMVAQEARNEAIIDANKQFPMKFSPNISVLLQSAKFHFSS